MKQYLLLLAVSLFVAHNAGTAYGTAVNTLMTDVATRLERAVPTGTLSR